MSYIIDFAFSPPHLGPISDIDIFDSRLFSVEQEERMFFLPVFNWTVNPQSFFSTRTFNILSPSSAVLRRTESRVDQLFRQFLFSNLFDCLLGIEQGYSSFLFRRDMLEISADEYDEAGLPSLYEYDYRAAGAAGHDAAASGLQVIQPREREDRFQRYVAQSNTERLEEARTENKDGGNFLKSVLDDHISALPTLEAKEQYKEKISESDPELFVEVPKMAIEFLMKAKLPILESTTPHFFHNHLSDLRELKQKLGTGVSIDSEEARRLIGKIATNLMREADFSAAMEAAFKKFS